MLIKIEDQSVLLEITAKCHKSCGGYCYKGDSVSPNGEHVPVKVLNQRIDWLRRHTNTNSVTLLGGEPLLHPELGEIIEYLQNKNLIPGIITSAKVSPDQEHNLQLIQDLHKRGEIDVELSYHTGSNKTIFLELLQQFKANAPERRKHLEQLVRSTDGDPLNRRRLNNPTIWTTVTLDSRYGENSSKFIEMQQEILAWLGINVLTNSIDFEGEKIPAEQYFETIATGISQHFLPFSESEGFEFTFGIKDKSFEYKITTIGATGVEPTYISLSGSQIKVNKITPARGSVDEESVCPAMTTSVSEDNIEIDSLLVRNDGEISYSEPSCIAAKNMFGNIDKLSTGKQIYHYFLDAIQWRKQLIIETKAARATVDNHLCKEDPNFPKEYLDRNVYICPSCEFDLSCNICGAVDRDILRNSEDKSELIRTWIDVVETQLCSESYFRDSR